MKGTREIRAGLLALLGMALSACAVDGTMQLPAAEPTIYPPAVFTHRVGTSHVVLYWNCTRPEPGVLRAEGVAQQAGSSQAVRFLELELVGVDARERTVSEAAAALPDILLHTNQISPFRLDVRTVGSEVRFDLFYQYRFQENGGRFIPRKAILDAVGSYEIVEAYPQDKYLPSYLVLARSAGEAFHVLFATDVEGGNVRVVTAYRPSAEEWEDDLKTRRTRR